jgi:iron complex outermembrane receptor protein
MTVTGRSALILRNSQVIALQEYAITAGIFVYQIVERLSEMLAKQIRGNFKGSGRYFNKLTILFLLLCVAASVPAQVMEEVIVTAQKREQMIQDVPITITAFSGTQLEQLGFRDSTDIVQMTPGVSLAGSIGGQFVNFNIRGVNQNDFADINESPNAVYIDEAYVSLMQAHRFPLFDIERVEILKGPQGTLFGRNATGGLVHYITKKPTATFEAYSDFTYGSFDQTRFEGALGGVVSGNLNARVAVLYNHNDEILNNLEPGGDDEWGDETLAARGRFLWDLGGGSDILISAYTSNATNSSSPWQGFPTIGIVDADGNFTNTVRITPDETRAGIGPSGIDFCPLCFFGTRPVPGGDGFGYIDADGDDFNVRKDVTDDDAAEYKVLGATAVVNWDLGDLLLTSVTDYKSMKKEGVINDTDASPTDILNFQADAEDDQFSQEIRLSNQGKDTQWVLGLYYLDFNIDSTQGVFGPTPANALGLGGLRFVSPVQLDTQSLSLFGQFEYSLTEQLGVTAGLRVIRENKDFNHHASILLLDGTVIVPELEGMPGTIKNTRDLENDETLWAGKLQLDWHPRDDLMLYGGVNRGVKAGGFNQQLGGLFPIENFEYGSETLTAYEAGFKSTIFNGTTRFNGAVYFYDYNDYQAHAANNLVFFVINADAEYKGFELEIATQPISGLDILFSLSYVDAEVFDVPLATGPLGSGQKLLVDVEPTVTPALQFAGLARYEWQLDSAGSMAIQGDFSYTDGSFTNITNYDSTWMESYTIGNLRLSYTTANERWLTSVFVKNVTDKRAEQLGFDLTSAYGGSLRSYLPPRWYGISLKYSWF